MENAALDDLRIEYTTFVSKVFLKLDLPCWETCDLENDFKVKIMRDAYSYADTAFSAVLAVDLLIRIIILKNHGCIFWGLFKDSTTLSILLSSMQIFKIVDDCQVLRKAFWILATLTYLRSQILKSMNPSKKLPQNYINSDLEVCLFSWN